MKLPVKTPDGIEREATVEYKQVSDIEVNQTHAMAGFKQAFCGHMVPRHGEEYDNASPFSAIRFGTAKQAKRFAKAVIGTYIVQSID